MKEKSKKRTFSVNNVLKYLGVSTSGYYSFKNRKASRAKLRKRAVSTKIKEIYNASYQIYGAPKITKLLNEQGIKIAEKTVGNYMRDEGIKAIWVRPYTKTTIDPDFDDKLKNILDRQFRPAAPNAVWTTDITYVYTLKGFVYLTSVMDLYSRKIIGWHVSDRLTTDGVISAIENAKASRKSKRPTIIHSDRGVQFVSKDYKKATPARDYIRSYSHKGTPWDNAPIESFHALIKREWLNRYVIKDLHHAHKLIFHYIETFYNTTRIHSHCGMISPYDYELEFVS
ncbi:IS3 family transposase [Fusibacter paucivorans]|uniref:IS3 family transposase n=1 Tax=Fusibacter paucivorans TaxID=76009 RepID=UPI0031B84210